MACKAEGGALRALKKLRTQRGVSILAALLYFIVCAAIGSVVLTAGSAAIGRHWVQAEADQKYYSVSSAAELYREMIGAEKITVMLIRDPDPDTGDYTNYQAFFNDDSTDISGLDYADPDLDVSLTERAVLALYHTVYTASVDMEDLWDKSEADWNSSDTNDINDNPGWTGTFSQSVTDPSDPSIDLISGLQVTTNYKIQKNGGLKFQLSSGGSGDALPYTVTFDCPITVTIYEDSDVEKRVEFSWTCGGISAE